MTARATAAAVTASTVNQCNGTDNVGGQAVSCAVTVTNNLDLASGLTSSSLTTVECHGAAGAALPCVTTTTPSDQLITSVTQCDGSGSGGGGTVTCTVVIINNITGEATTAPATVNQCNASGDGGGIQPTVRCDPIGVTTNATITQCNDSGNGGGGTIRVQCTVTPSTQASALPITVNQCNGSGNGGGSTVTCTVTVTNNIIPLTVGVPPVVTPPGDTPPPVVPPPGDTPPPVVPPPGDTPPPVVTPPVVTPPVVPPPVDTPPVVLPPTGLPWRDTPPVVVALPGTPSADTVPAVVLNEVLLPAATPPVVTSLTDLPGTPVGVTTSRSALDSSVASTPGGSVTGSVPAGARSTATSLPLTGANTGPMALLGVLALALGGLLVLVARRRTAR